MLRAARRWLDELKFAGCIYAFGHLGEVPEHLSNKRERGYEKRSRLYERRLVC
jgi:hypothetical protein